MFRTKKLKKEIRELKAKNRELEHDNQVLAEAGVCMARALNDVKKVASEQHYNSIINFQNKIKKILDELRPNLKSL